MCPCQDSGVEPRELTDGRILLRLHRPEDVDGVLAQSRDPESARWTTVPQPYARTDAEEFALRIVPAGWAADSSYSFAIIELDRDGTGEDRYAGTIDVRPDGAGAAELGYGLGPWARGRGLVTAALRLAVDWSFAPPPEGLGLSVLTWQAHVGNWASRRAAWRVGFRVEGTVRGLCAQRGSRRDAWVGSLLAGDPREPTTAWIETPTLQGSGVLLRRWRRSDAAAVVEACTDPVSRRWLGELPSPYGEAEAREFIQSRENNHAAGTALHLAAALDADGAAVGSFSLLGIGAGRGVAEVGYWVHPAARGRGVATEAVRLLVRHALVPIEDGGLGLRRLVLFAATENAASRRVAEKNGFVGGGVRRASDRLGDGTWADLYSYDLLAGDLA